MKKLFNQFESDESTRKNVRTSAFLSSLAGTVPTLLLGKGLPSYTKAGIFFGTSTGLGIASDTIQGVDVGSAVLSNTLAAAAGYVAYSQQDKVADIGIETLKSFLTRQGNQQWDKTVEMFNRARRVHPIFSNFLSRQTIGMGLAIATIPIAHSFIQRTISNWHRERKTMDPVSVFQMENQAGDERDRYEDINQNPYNPHASVDVKMTQTLNTQYNMKQIGNSFR